MSESFISSRASRAERLEPMAEKVAQSAARLQQIEDGTPEQARAFRAERGNPFAPQAVQLAEIKDLQIPLSRGSVRVRSYLPPGLESDKLPCLIFYHGGGYVLSTVDDYDTVTQRIALYGGCRVLSVDYELAPANKIGSIHQDGFEVYRWVREHAAELGIDPQRIALGGDSAGGNLTVAVTHACKQSAYPQAAFQVLLYPSVDLSMHFPSIDEFATGSFLTRKGMAWFRSHYLESPAQADDPELRFLDKDLSGLPPAYVITAGFDPLRDEGQAYADRLAECGVAVKHACYTDMIHAFISFAGGIEAGEHALQRIGDELRSALAS